MTREPLHADAIDATRQQTTITTKGTEFATHHHRAYGRILRAVATRPPGESATWAMTSHPDSRQGRPMTSSVGHPADGGSLLASRDSALSAPFLNDVLQPTAALVIYRNLGPHWSTNQIVVLQRWLDEGSPP